MKGKQTELSQWDMKKSPTVHYSKKNKSIELLEPEEREEKLHGNCKHMTSREKTKTKQKQQSMQKRKT